MNTHETVDHPPRARTGSYVIVAPLDEMPLGFEFRTDAWPLHLTVVPPFTTRLPLQRATDVIESACLGIPPSSARAGRRALFGRHRDVPVVTLDPEPALHALHVALLDALEPFIAQGGDPRHVRDGYRPHVTAQRGREIAPGASVLVDRVALVDRRPDERAGLRRIVALVRLSS
jgi:hypothetical protein